MSLPHVTWWDECRPDIGTYEAHMRHMMQEEHLRRMYLGPVSPTPTPPKLKNKVLLPCK